MKQESHFFGSEIFVLCCNRHNVFSKAKLLQVDIEINVQFVVPIDLHPFNQAVDNHLFRFQVCLVVHLRPGNNVLIPETMGDRPGHLADYCAQAA